MTLRAAPAETRRDFPGKGSSLPSSEEPKPGSDPGGYRSPCSTLRRRDESALPRTQRCPFASASIRSSGRSESGSRSGGGGGGQSSSLPSSPCWKETTSRPEPSGLQRRKRQRRRGCYSCCCFKAGKRGRSRKGGGGSEQIAALPVAQGSEGEHGLAGGRAQQVRGGRGLGFLFREKGRRKGLEAFPLASRLLPPYLISLKTPSPRPASLRRLRKRLELQFLGA